MSFEHARRSVNQSISLDRKIIGYKARNGREPICEEVKNITMEIYEEDTNTNSNGIHTLINVCLERYNKHKLCANIDSGCFTYF